MKPSFSDGELAVMKVLWDRGDGTVREVMEAFDDDRAYQTYLSQLQSLEKKGHVDHKQEGRAYRYHPATSRMEAQRMALRRVIQRLFRSRPEDFVSRLLEMWEPTEGEREEVLGLLEDAR